MRKILFALLMFIGFAHVASAAKLPTFYKAEFPVSSQSQETRTEAIQQGLVQILNKISGNAEIEKNPLIQAELQKAKDYVEEFNYIAYYSKSKPYLIQIRYDAESIHRLLKKAEIPYWGDNKPIVLVWLAVSRPEQSLEIIGNETSDNFLFAMKEQSQKQGLSVIFPMMDIADVSLVLPSDVRDMSIPLLKEVGKRYVANTMLIGHIEQNQEGFQSQWQLVTDEQQISFSAQEKSESKLITNVITEVNRALAKNFMAKVEVVKDSWLKLAVANISQHEDLSKLMQVLRDLPSVKQITLSQITDHNVEIALLVQDSIDNFAQHDLLDKKLVLKSQDDKDNKLNYEWVG